MFHHATWIIFPVFSHFSHFQWIDYWQIFQPRLHRIIHFADAGNDGRSLCDVAWHDDLVGGVMNEPGNKTGNFWKCGDVLFHHIKKAYIFVHCYIFALRQNGFDSDPSKWLWINLAEIQRFPHGNWAWHCACSVPKKNAGCCFAVGFITFRFLDAKYTKHYLFKTFLHLTILFKTGQCSVLVSLFSLSLSLSLSLSPSLPLPTFWNSAFTILIIYIWLWYIYDNIIYIWLCIYIYDYIYIW